MGFSLTPRNIIAGALAPFTYGASLAFAQDDQGNTGLDYVTGAKSAREQEQRQKKYQDEVNAKSIELSNTAHQREVADLQAAGLNPVLSAGGTGATTPTLNASIAQNEMPGGYMAQATQAAGIIGTLAGAQQAGTAATLQNAQAAKTNVETALAPQIAKAEMTKNLAEAGQATSAKNYNEIRGQVDMMLGDAQTEKALAEAGLIKKDTKGRITMNAINTGANALNGIANVIGSTKGMNFNPMTINSNSARSYNYSYGGLQLQ